MCSRVVGSLVFLISSFSRYLVVFHPPRSPHAVRLRHPPDVTLSLGSTGAAFTAPPFHSQERQASLLYFCHLLCLYQKACAETVMSQGAKYFTRLVTTNPSRLLAPPPETAISWPIRNLSAFQQTGLETRWNFWMFLCFFTDILHISVTCSKQSVIKKPKRLALNCCRVSSTKRLTSSLMGKGASRLANLGTRS